MELGAGRDDDGLVVRRRRLPRLDDRQSVYRLRQASIKLGQHPSRLILHVGEGVSADQIEPIEPKNGSGFDRFQEPGNRLAILPDDEKQTASSLLPLPYAYIVPGGRFREIYYWDSYFTQLGLLADHEEATFQAMVRNFAYLVQDIGHI